MVRLMNEIFVKFELFRGNFYLDVAMKIEFKISGSRLSKLIKVWRNSLLHKGKGFLSWKESETLKRL